VLTAEVNNRLSVYGKCTNNNRLTFYWCSQIVKRVKITSYTMAYISFYNKRYNWFLKVSEIV